MRIVICGAGTAGCVIAARLSEDARAEVLLLERGPHYRPGAWPPELRHSHRIVKDTHDWGYLARAGASPRLVHVPRGQVVGGSSATNGAVALRGHPEHYDEWDAHVDGFGWDTWREWFNRIETDRDHPGAPHHGDAGPIAISRWPRPWAELQERFCEAALSAGHGWVDDHNAPGAIGIGPIPLNMIDGARQTPADHYLDPALGRANLHLETGVVVDRVEMAGGRVTAVSGYDVAGRNVRWQADVVIMALGTYATPAALLRSGIGPADELARHGIARTLDPLAGVGLGMQDHPKISYRFELEIPPATWPHPWYQCLLTGAHDVDGSRRVYQVMPYSGQTAGGHRFTDLNVQVADAAGRRGRVRLQGPDPGLQPTIEMGWLVEDADRAAARAAGERLLEVARAPALAAIMSGWPNQDHPDHALRVVETFHHPVGSCRMGRADDPGAVVDAGGRVFGAEDLYVMDAAVIPRLPSANTHLAVIALAERLADRFRRLRLGE